MQLEALSEYEPEDRISLLWLILRVKYTSRHLNRPVVVVSSEVNPWSKTGGLGMVAGSYGYEFVMRGHRTMVVSPRYAAYQKVHKVGSTTIWLDGRNHEVKFFHLYQDLGGGNGTDYIFVGHDCFMRDHFYCDPHNGTEYLDIVKVLFTVVRITIEILTTCSASLFSRSLRWKPHWC